MSDLRPRPILTVAHAPIVDDFTAEHFDETIGNLSTAVETLVDDQSWLLELGPELADQLGLAVPGRVRDVDVANFSAAGPIDALAILLDPGQVAQPSFAGHCVNQYFAALFQRWFAIDGQEHRFVGHTLEGGIRLEFGIERDAINCEQIVSFLDVDTGAF